jgi:4'-phosphopantetheinyl transferase
MSAELPEGQAHVWFLRTPSARSADLAASLARMLSEEERSRASRFHFDRDATSFILSHALLRTVLSRYAPLGPADWRFRANEHGCPFVADAAQAWLRFNLSHTDGCAAVVVARGADVGIDVESLSRRPVAIDVAERYFAPAEVADVHSASDADRHRVFLEIWTLKEAYIKARGVGLALGLREFTCRRGRNGPPSIAFTPTLDDDAASWQLHQLTPTPQHVGAVAVRRAPGRDVELAVRQLDAFS